VKNVLTAVAILIVATYLACVVICNIEHNKEQGIKGMNPCGSCWALKK